MHVLICNERFLFRFGVDRVLLILARALRQRGHSVTLMACRAEERLTREVSDRVVLVPSREVPYLDLDRSTSGWLAGNWPRQFPEGAEPQVAVVGGWPFFGAIGSLAARGVPSVFLDFGAVPLEGLDEGQSRVQLELQRCRREALGRAAAAISISEFIAESQTRVDAPRLRDVRVIPLGADHLEPRHESRRGRPVGERDDGEALAKVRQHVDSGRRVVLQLGRWEPGNYKRSQDAFEVVRWARENGAPAFSLAVLERPDRLEMPADLDGTILPIGHPDDRELWEIMSLVDAGLTTSTWEGFNLPLAEMQWVDKPVLALRRAAHPEVVCYPWCLCRDLHEMAVKLVDLVDGGVPDRAELLSRAAEFRARHSWRRLGVAYSTTVEEVGERGLSRIVVDVSNACLDAANGGIIRVTRRLSRELQSRTPVSFALFDDSAGAYVLPNEEEYGLLGRFNGPRTQGAPKSPRERRLLAVREQSDGSVQPPWLLLPELLDARRAKRIRRMARWTGMRIAAIFYDAIPLLEPGLVGRTVKENHADYMSGLAECDLVLAISESSREALAEHWAGERLTGPELRTIRLPEELASVPRARQPKELRPGGTLELLCVSTLEPRKGHLALLRAVSRLDLLAPDLDWRLTLVGKRYGGEEDAIALAVRATAEAEERVRWLGPVDDETLSRLYRESTLTVYPSVIEGFGLPIVESLWYATPVICHDAGVMRELASNGGCELTDARDPTRLAAAIVELATDPERYSELSRQAVRRHRRTWEDYSAEVFAAIEEASA